MERSTLKRQASRGDAATGQTVFAINLDIHQSRLPLELRKAAPVEVNLGQPGGHCYTRLTGRLRSVLGAAVRYDRLRATPGDRLDVSAGESYLRDVRDQDAWAAGVRWDAARRLAIKTDRRSQLTAAGKRERTIRAQIAFWF